MAVSRIMKSLVTGYAILSIPDFEIGPSHILHVDEEIGPLSSPQFLSSDPYKSHAAEVIGAHSFFDPFCLSDPGKSHAAEVIGAHSFFDRFRLSDPGKSRAAEVIGAHSFFDPFRLSDPGKSHAAEETGALWYLDQFLPFNPVKFHVQEDPDKYAYVQSHYRGSDTGMSGAGGGKGKDGEPTKDDERTLAWKLRLSVKAVTPKFNASAKISLEKKSG